MNPCSPCDKREGRAEADNGVTNCVFLFFIPLIYSFPRLHCHPSTPHSPQPLLRSVPILSALGGGRPIAMVMRGVNWPCCVFRRLDNDGGSGGLGGDNFLNFLRMPTCCFSHKLKSSPMRVLYPGGGRIKDRLSTWGLTYRHRHLLRYSITQGSRSDAACPHKVELICISRASWKKNQGDDCHTVMDCLSQAV